MRTGAASLRWPLALAGGWLASASLSALAVPITIATVPYWHDVRVYLQQLGLWQTWISIAACVGLLVISRQKHSENEEAWAQGALLIFVLGGMVTAILINYGVLPQWLVQSNDVLKQLQLLVLMLLHWLCALLTLRSLLQFRKRAEVAGQGPTA